MSMMRVPIRWLKMFVNFEDSPEEIGNKLIEVGVPISQIERVGIREPKIVIAKVHNISNHPKHERLRVVKLIAGKFGELQAVTVASNLYKGAHVAVALRGAQLISGLKVEPKEVRGVISEAMILPPSEIGLEYLYTELQRDHAVILDQIDDNFNWENYLGEPLENFIPLWDDVLVVESFANRPDLLSVIGIAYELAYITGSQITHPPSDGDNPTSQDIVDIRIDVPANLCARYHGRRFKVEVKRSPIWMAQLLNFAGIRPINNVVDVTNWVLVELGQPMHAFDYRKLQGDITVRLARSGESILALNGNEYKLSGELIIADSSGPIAIAGIIGSESTGVTSATEEILLECANFNQALVRRAELRLGLRTESSIRFEKGLPVELVDLGIARATYLLKEVAQAVPIAYRDVKLREPQKRIITVRSEKISALLGEEVTRDDIVETLKPLGFRVHSEGNVLRVEPPLNRRDLNLEVDIAEEIARLKGYEYWGQELPLMVPTGYQDERESFCELIRDRMVRLGFSEAITFSLISSEKLNRWLSALREDIRPVKILNPLSSERAFLRPLILPNLLESVKRNLSYGEAEIALFELGNTFLYEDSYKEILSLAAVCTSDVMSALELKAILMYVLEPFEVQLEFEPKQFKFLHPYVSAEVRLNGEPRGFIGQLHPELRDELELVQDIVMFELAFNVPLRRRQVKYRALSKFRKLYRDLSLIVPEDVKIGELFKVASRILGNMLDKAYLFDVYRGEGIPEGFISYTLRFELRPRDKQVTQEELQHIFDQIVRWAETNLGAKLRGV